MMNIKDAIKLVLQSMWEKKGRVFLTISGIIIGIFTFIFFIFAAQGLSNAITNQFTSFGVNVLTVQVSEGSGQAGPPSGSGLTDTDVERIKKVTNNVKYVAPVIFYQGQYEYGKKTQILTSLAYVEESLDLISQDLGFEYQEGRGIRQNDRGVIVLGGQIAKNGFGTDSQISVGTSLTIQEQRLRVVGILEERGDLFVDNSVILPFQDIKTISGQDTYTNIRVSFFEGTDLQAQKEAIERELNPGSENRVRISSPQEAIDQLNNIVGVLTFIIAFISSIALLVGGINVMNTMYSSVIERINEISVIKALGGKNSDILLIFLIESSLLGFIGSILGFLLAYGLAELLSFIISSFTSYTVPITFDITLFILVVIITSLIATLFGTYPAVKAAKTNPSENLRDE